MRIIQARFTVSMTVGPLSVGVAGLFAVDRVCLDLHGITCVKRNIPHGVCAGGENANPSLGVLG